MHRWRFAALSVTGGNMTIIRRSYILRIDTDPVVRLWTGFGDLATPADAVDPSGATWQGSGGILSLPAIRSLIGGVSDRVAFTVSGVDAETLRLAREDKDEVEGAEVRLGYVLFDQHWQLTGGVTWQWRGVADILSIESATDDDGQRTRSIRLSVAGADTRRRNPRLSFWTDQSQRQRSSDDAFCSFVSQISISVTRRFGPT